MPPPLVPDHNGEGDSVDFGHNEVPGDRVEPFRVVSDVLSPAGGRSVVSPQHDAEAEQELDDQLNSGPAGQQQQQQQQEQQQQQQQEQQQQQQQQDIITPDEQPGPEIPEGPLSSARPVADMDIPEGALADDELPASDELPAAVASAKKRGRPSAKPGKKAPSKAKSPRSAATTSGVASRATSGRKRKADDVDDGNDGNDGNNEPDEEATPAKRPRGRPARGAVSATSARLAAKIAKKAKPGRPKGSGTAPKATTNPRRGGSNGASKKDSSTNDEVVPKGEYEVEEILESVIDADTSEHMYRVKWKGYGLDEATWEPKTNLEHAAALIKAFDAKQPKPKQTRKPRRAAATTNGTAAPRATKSKSKEVKKPGRPVGRPRKSVGRPPTKPAAVAKPVAKKPAGRPAPTRRGGRPRRVGTSKA